MKLIFEYDGKQYGFKGPDATGFCSIVDSDGVFNKQLWEKFCEFEANEEKKHEFGYWWESQVSLARRAMEKEGAKILEFEDEVIEKVDKKGRSVVF